MPYIQRLGRLWLRLHKKINILHKRRETLGWELRYESEGNDLHRRAGLLIDRQAKINKEYKRLQALQMLDDYFAM